MERNPLSYTPFIYLYLFLPIDNYRPYFTSSNIISIVFQLVVKFKCKYGTNKAVIIC